MSPATLPRSRGVHLVLSLGRPDPDRLSTAMLGSLIAHVVLLAGALVWQALPSATATPGPSRFVTLASPARSAGGGGGRPEREAPKPRVTPPAPKEPVPEPPAPPVHAPTKASLPSDKPPKPAPPARPHDAPSPPGASEGHASEDAGASGAGVPGAAPGAPGGATGEAGGIGGTAFGEGDFRYGWYQTSIESKLRSSWRKPAATAGETQTATVSFLILRNGTVRDVQVVTPSGNPAMDISAMRAVYDANPLPVLPRGWDGDSVHVSMEFSLEPGAP
jgi:TonB family protein